MSNLTFSKKKNIQYQRRGGVISYNLLTGATDGETITNKAVSCNLQLIQVSKEQCQNTY